VSVYSRSQRFGARRPSELLQRAHEPHVLLASNRLPWTVNNNRSGLLPSVGGLATALAGFHSRARSLWLGWDGQPAEEAEPFDSEIRRELGRFRAVPVPLTSRDVDQYYHAYSNSILWPALHGFSPLIDEQDEHWVGYRRVNERFARTIAEHVRPGDCVWVHDFHLMLVPRLLREIAPRIRTGFFLHTPFPDPAAFARIDRATELIDGILAADLIGLQTPDDVGNFLRVVDHTDTRARDLDVHAYPIGIDVGSFETLAGRSDVELDVQRLRSTGVRLLLGVDRLDYTKGIPQRLLAYERLLTDSPELHRRVKLIQIAVPSRAELSAYKRLRKRVEALVARINFRFGDADWMPVEYRYQTVDPATLVALYRAADVMLVTPIRDGMNLVAKEFVASRTDGDGVLLLSRTAGAATELRAALLVDPRNVKQLAATLSGALMMSANERKTRIRHLRAAVSANDATHWADRFLTELKRDRPVSMLAR
jgi:trehalose 6-phosphate synthase/phosphatase